LGAAPPPPNPKPPIPNPQSPVYWILKFKNNNLKNKFK